MEDSNHNKNKFLGIYCFIMQGHIICDDCHRQRISHDARTGNKCHSCRGPITGRPNALEKMAGLI